MSLQDPDGSHQGIACATPKRRSGRFRKKPRIRHSAHLHRVRTPHATLPPSRPSPPLHRRLTTRRRGIEVRFELDEFANESHSSAALSLFHMRLRPDLKHPKLFFLEFRKSQALEPRVASTSYDVICWIQPNHSETALKLLFGSVLKLLRNYSKTT